MLVPLSLALSAPWLVGAWAAVLCTAVAFLLPDLRVRRAAIRRKDFATAISAYLDLVAMRAASGSGITEALRDAARIGSGPTFAMVREALDNARMSGQSPAAGLGLLGSSVQGRRGSAASPGALRGGVERLGQIENFSAYVPDAAPLIVEDGEGASRELGKLVEVVHGELDAVVSHPGWRRHVRRPAIRPGIDHVRPQAARVRLREPHQDKRIRLVHFYCHLCERLLAFVSDCQHVMGNSRHCLLEPPR